jgi:hypothetical protein
MNAGIPRKHQVSCEHNCQTFIYLISQCSTRVISSNLCISLDVNNFVILLQLKEKRRRMFRRLEWMSQNGFIPLRLAMSSRIIVPVSLSVHGILGDR